MFLPFKRTLHELRLFKHDFNEFRKSLSLISPITRSIKSAIFKGEFSFKRNELGRYKWINVSLENYNVKMNCSSLLSLSGIKNGLPIYFNLFEKFYLWPLIRNRFKTFVYCRKKNQALARRLLVN